MRRIPLIALCSCLCFAALLMSARASPADSDAAIGPDATWQPGVPTIQMMREACTTAPPEQYGECLISKMPAAGAPAEAVAFTRRLQNEMGQIAYARNFRKVGKVDVVSVEYMLRANENRGWLLVNGTPPLIDVDDMQRLPKDDLLSDPAYAALAQRYPRVMLFPGDRSGTGQPQVETLPDRGERFVVRYQLQNGCHACERIGSATFAFDFDHAGRFLGTRLLAVDTEKDPR
jgi:hypothetical protein